MPKHGPGESTGQWIKDRADHILASSDLKTKGKKGKSIAFALATLQAHRLGKSPKANRTREGMELARAKYDKPRSEYRKTPGPTKTSSLPSAAVPTPAFPQGLRTVAPSSTGQTSTIGKVTKPKSRPYTQVHTLPPMVGSQTGAEVKRVPPPSPFGGNR